MMQTLTTDNKKIYGEIQIERNKQNYKWGEQNHEPLKWLAILSEEVGEVSKAILENLLPEYRKELIQVAAVVITAIEALDRGKIDAKNLNKEIGNVMD